MTLTEAQTQFNALADRLSAAKAVQKAALVALGRTPTDVWDTYPDELRAVTGGTGNYQESKTVAADPAGMTILPDEGYSGMLKAIIAAEPNFQPWNLVDGIEAWGITGTAKPATTSDAPTNLPVSKDDADTAYETETGAAPTETDYFVCVDNDGNITYWYLSESFEITSYNPINTDFAAKGAVRLAYHTTGENAGKWTHDNFYDTPSKGWNYLKNIRSCTREKLYYQGVEVWPNYGGNYVWETLVDTMEVTTAVNENTGIGYPVSWPYAFGDSSKNLTFDDFYWSDQNTEVPYLRITVDGVSAIFPLEYMTVDYLCGNHHIALDDEYADNGYDFCVQFSPGGAECATGFSSRNPGTYKVKIEKAVSING